MKLVILDRDGVINHDADERTYIKAPEEWVPIAGSLEAVAALNASGYTVCVASNQSGLARGKFDATALQAIHEKMRRELASVGGHIDAIYFCPHLPEAGCDCRKPKPGLLLQIARDFGVSLTSVPFIGDSKRDVEAAMNGGAMPVLVRTGNGATAERSGSLPPDIKIYDDLAAAVQVLLNGHLIRCDR